MYSDWKMKLYWCLPVRLQEAFLSLYACHLDQLYFGGLFLKTTREVKSRSFADLEAVRKYQLSQLKSMIRTAVKDVPYYHRTLGSECEVASFDDLRCLPQINSQQIRGHEHEFLSKKYDISKMFIEKTSGSTGTSLKSYWDRNSLQCRWAINEVRCRLPIGVSQELPRAMVGGRPVVPGNTTSPPYWRLNRRWRQLYMSSYHISHISAKHYIEALRESGISWLTGYGSAIAALAEIAIEQRLRPVEMRAVLVSGDTLQPSMRKAIEEFFQCKCYDHYGQAEGVCWVMECQFGKMHVIPEFGVLEILDQTGNPCAPGEVGEMVATGLINRAMPLIRYRMGDEASWAVDQACDCGQHFPVIQRLEGRTDDYLITSDKRRIGRLSTAVKRSPSIHSLQIVQDCPNHAYLLVRPGKTYQTSDANAVVRDITERIGAFSITVRIVESIPRTKAGKTRLVVRLSDSPELINAYRSIIPLVG